MKSKQKVEFTIVMPCLNEERTLPICIRKVHESFKDSGISYEIVVADNGSTDNSVKIAKKLGARVVHVESKGYGAALTGGIAVAKGKYVIMGDSDDSYDFSKLKPFINKLQGKYEFVMGNRFAGEIKQGAMPLLHRFVGNPFFSFIGRVFFKSEVGDFYCGLRGFEKQLWKKMALQATGMEFAIEMVIKATLLKAKIAQVPIVLHKDGRLRKPHLRTWKDGWRTLRFILLFAPSWLFLLPGLTLIIGGILLDILAIPGNLEIFNVIPDIHTLLVSSTFIVVGLQAMLFGLFTKLLIYRLKLLPVDKTQTSALAKINPANIFLLSVILVIVGTFLIGGVVFGWYQGGFGRLEYSSTMRIVIPSVTFILLGVQLFFNAFFLDILMLPKPESGE